MKRKFYYLSFTALLYLLPNVHYAQSPNLGSTANFVLFSSDGAVSNSGISHLTGNVGTNNGSSTNFGNVNGGMHDGDATSALAVVDLFTAYTYINNLVPDFNIAPGLGNGQTLIEGVYAIPSASTINLDLNLDAQNDPSAIFIFQIAGPLSTNAMSKVKLINGAQACNVYWKVEGLVDMATGTTMRGTVIANNAGINMNSGDTLEGRLLTTTGAITVDGVLAYTPVGCGSPTLNGPIAPTLGEVGCYGIFSGGGPSDNTGITNIIGDVGANTGLTTGFNSLLVTGNIHPVPDGSTAQAAADFLVAYNYVLGLSADIELLYPAQFGNNLVLTPHTYILNGATTFTDTLYLNAEGNANAVFVIKIYGALETSTYSKVILTNGTQAKNVYWLVSGAVDINGYSIFNGTILSQGAISLMFGTELNGRALNGTGSMATNTIDGAADIVPANCQTIVGGPISVDEMNVTEIVSIYPNPFQNRITVNIKNAELKNYVLIVYNVLGEEVNSFNLSNETTTLDLGAMSKGMYFYQLNDTVKNIQSGTLIAQ